MRFSSWIGFEQLPQCKKKMYPRLMSKFVFSSAASGLCEFASVVVNIPRAAERVGRSLRRWVVALTGAGLGGVQLTLALKERNKNIWKLKGLIDISKSIIWCSFHRIENDFIYNVTYILVIDRWKSVICFWFTWGGKDNFLFWSFLLFEILL